MAALLSTASAIYPAHAADIETVVVTAERHEADINKVGMSIQAFSGAALKAQRVTNVTDLGTVVPSFNVSQSYEGVPTFTLRGIGFNTVDLSATSTVGTYVDEVAYAYPFMMAGPLFDVQRVEVLKGPQGTLYGRNTTAGLIDLITNKPTDDFAASVTAEGGNNGTYNFEGFISGPLTDTLKGRFAFRTEDSADGWQHSNSRPGDTLGRKHNYGARGELEWKPTSQLTVNLTVDGWINRSDSVAAQATGLTVAAGPPNAESCLQLSSVFTAAFVPGFTPGGVCPATTLPIGGLVPVAGLPIDTRLQNYLAANQPTKGSQADWEPAAQRGADIGTGLGMNRPLAENDNFYSIAGRVDYRFNDNISATSLTAFNHVKRDGVNDWSGAPYEILVQNEVGHIGSFSEELRLQGDTDTVHWMVGGYYANDTIFDGDRTMLGQNSSALLIRSLGEVLLATPPFNAINTFGTTPTQMAQAFRTFGDRGTIDSNTWSAFVNADWQLTDTLKLTGGIRYTQDHQTFAGCSFDVNGNLATSVNIVNRTLFPLIYGVATPAPIGTGDCVSFNPATDSFGVINEKLDEDNLAWRIAADWQVSPGTLLYASVSKGYKAGNIPIIAANIASQEVPAKQERLLSYEVGVKTALADGKVQLNLAAFYYDYGDKQLSVLFADPIYTVLGRVANIPTSHADGVDGDVTWAITDRLTAMLAATYVETYVGNYLGVDESGNPANFKGSQFPYSPHWQGALTLNYDTPITDTLGLQATVNEHWQSKSCADLCTDAVYAIKSYGLLNASIGLHSLDNNWLFSIWGRNLTNQYYWTSVANNTNTYVRFPGMTMTYGASLTYNFN
ncbi:MAG: TonB-dependent receptor [Rhizomicrobium sp.]